MISRREKLLIRPWEQRRYENHRRKVQSAAPAIDVGPPANRVHVSYKVKKHQKETERCSKIEKDNLKLLQRLRGLMSTSRVNNTWTTAQPNFLNRVTLYNNAGKINKSVESPSSMVEEKTRKERCSACTPKKVQRPVIPEERVPWPPPKPPVSRKRSQSLPPRKLKISEQETSKKDQSRKNSLPKTPQKPKKNIQQLPKPIRSKSSQPVRRSFSGKNDITQKDSQNGQSIILSRGDIRLAVSFPPDTLIKFKSGYKEQLIKNGTCQCKAIRAQ